MSQLTTIEQCKVGDIVYHPLLGKGEITMVMYKGCNVRFKDVNGQSRGKIFNEDPDSLISNISHLFTEPVYICTRKEYSVTTYRSGRKEIEYSYKPVNQEQ